MSIADDSTTDGPKTSETPDAPEVESHLLARDVSELLARDAPRSTGDDGTDDATEQGIKAR